MNRITMLAALGAVASIALAGPGAHGPGGEHLDGPGVTGSPSPLPRIEATSESFELVGRLVPGELSILVDRFETNEPVLDGKLEVQLRGLRAPARFHADHGYYSVDDAAMLKALSAPGQHPLVFTLAAGNESDLLEGTLAVPAAATPSAHDHPDRKLIAVLAAAAALVLVAAVLLLRRRRRATPHAMVALLVALSSAMVAHAGPGAHGPGGEHLDAPGAGSAGGGLARLADGSVIVPKTAQRRMEIRTILAPEREVASTIELPGKVIADPNAGGRVQAAHGGRIEAGPQGLPSIGKAVRRGEVLAYVRHHGEPFAVANQQAQLAETRAARQVAEQRVKRLESLEGTVARKDVEAARAELQGLAAKERSIGGSLAAREALLAPVGGVIARADAIVGQVVDTGHVLFEVVDPRRVIVEATTSDVALASRLGPAELRGIPGVKLEVLGVARSLRDGVLPVTFRARPDKANAAIPVAVGQSVTVIASATDKTRGIVLPAASVIRGPANETIVWIKTGVERFLPQPVEVRPVDANTVVAVKGLAPDNRVVIRGASLLAQIR